MPLCKEDDLRLRRAIVSELGKTGSLAVFGILLNEIADPESQLRESAIRSAIELIAHADSANSHAVRITVGTHLQQVADQDTVDKLAAVVDAPAPQIRRNAIWVLCRLIDPSVHTESLDELIAAIADDDETTAKMTVSKLAKCTDTVVLEKLDEFVETNEIESRVMQRVGYIRDQIETKTADDRLKDAVEYTKVSDPADYTKKHADK
jgi:HEAT repeat protein